MSLFPKEQLPVQQALRKGHRCLRGCQSDGEALPQCGLQTQAITTRFHNRTAVH